MDLAVVGIGGDEVVHVRGLRIPAEDIVVIGRAGFDHQSQGSTSHLGGEDPSAVEPIRVLGVLPGRMLLGRAPKTSAQWFSSTPGWPEYSRSAVWLMTPWESSWPMIDTDPVKPVEHLRRRRRRRP